MTYTAVLDVRRETAETPARLLREHRGRLGTRKNTRSPGVFKQAVPVLRWFIDGARLSQLARDNGISLPTAYRYLHKGLTTLAHHAPDLSTVPERAAAAGYTHLNLDGTIIRTDRVAAPGPNGADLWWSGKHKHHGGNVQVISAPDGRPLWVSPVRPGREHDTTCARTHGLLAALNRLATILDIPTLTDLGHENAGPGFRHPVKKPRGRELTTRHKTFNQVIRGIHGAAERANALLKATFKALRRVSLDPGSITRIARAALVLLQLETGRGLRGSRVLRRCRRATRCRLG
ncbi:transposase family protein (plasmid) [Streptomyces sp. NBC_01136]|uniref:HARBI1 family protein n=1 Tax=unclassified Streptomyces TaxID=2593676 RepID=UPI002F907AE6|nr:transposase family protein [Streptomyces sp. NBC_01136]